MVDTPLKDPLTLSEIVDNTTALYYKTIMTCPIIMSIKHLLCCVNAKQQNKLGKYYVKAQ